MNLCWLDKEKAFGQKNKRKERKPAKFDVREKNEYEQYFVVI